MVDAGGSERMHVSQQADVLIASSAADELAASLGFTEQERAEVILVVRELATNIVKHAGEGEVALSVRSGEMVVEAADRGPGIADVDEAVTDGFSTAGSLGYGLGTVNRLMDDMVITSQRGHGTTVTARRAHRRDDVDAGPCPFDVGVATAPKTGLDQNGDGFVIVTRGHRLVVAVIDGVGHGDLAHAAASVARRYVESHADQPLESVMRGTARACRGTRGVVMAVARLDWRAMTLEFCSIGNIEARVVGGPRPESFVVRRGILGVNAPAARSTTQPLDPSASLILHSDGVATHWEPGAADEALAGSASQAATGLLGRYSRGTDDATVVVVKGPRA
jgi:anti-sigma regulatory factor (Ser/Thr protein kinase)